MRRLYSVFATLLLLTGQMTHAAGGGTSVNSGVPGISSGLAQFKVLPLKSYALEGTLPPEIQAKFQLRCNQEFINIIRNEVVDATTRRTYIILGAIVSEDSSNKCVGTFDVEVYAGTAFSGRDHRIKSLN
jgi:hypothetical protein